MGLSRTCSRGTVPISFPCQVRRGKSGSICGSISTCQLAEEFFHPQNITADLCDYWNCHELLGLCTRCLWSHSEKVFPTHGTTPCKSIKAGWTAPRFTFQTRKLKFCKTDVWDITLMYPAMEVTPPALLIHSKELLSWLKLDHLVWHSTPTPDMWIRPLFNIRGVFTVLEELEDFKSFPWRSDSLLQQASTFMCLWNSGKDPFLFFLCKPTELGLKFALAKTDWSPATEVAGIRICPDLWPQKLATLSPFL